MNKIFAVLVGIISFLQVNAQYYYQDVLGTTQTNKQNKIISENHIQKINATSFEGNSRPSEDFILEQIISNNGRQIVTRSASVNSSETYFTSLFNNGKLIKTVDSSNNAINSVHYEYDNDGKLLGTTATGKDFDGTLISLETHQWKYNSNDQPQSMLKVKNAKDSTAISFKYDESGNVAEENWKKNNRIIETYYYYYNPKNQLTDIVRFNRKAKQMLPDFIFEYDAEGRIYQMTQMQGGTANYLVWRYTYSPNGLKAKEFVFNKQKELLGKIEYAFQ